MATYIQNVQDKVTQVRPPQTNWQFEAQLLSTRQAKYDAGHNKLSKMYGQILNAGLTREGNVEAREEFFQLIDNDLRKVAGVDLSLDSNVTQARAVFNQIYDNDFLVKDMVWTKNFQGEMKRAEGFKNCVDPAECGGQYWEDGVKAMNYKREEFKNSTNNESMRVQNVRYVPFNNMMKQAMADMETAGLDITTMPDPQGGKWKMKVRNGKNAIGPLTDLFSGLYGNNPQFQDQFKVLAYNARKDWTYNAVQSGEFATLNEAAGGYVEMRASLIQDNFDRTANGVKQDVDALTDKLKAYQEDSDNGLLTREGLVDANNTRDLLDKAKNVESYLDLVKNAQKNINSQSSMDNIGDYLDNVEAFNLFNNQINLAARTFANKNSEITREENKYAINQQQHGFDVAMANLNYKHDRSLLYLRAELGDFDTGSDAASKALEKQLTAQKAYETANGFDMGTSMIAGMAQIDGYTPVTGEFNLEEGMTDEQVEQWIGSLSTTSAEDQSIVTQANKIFTKYKTDRINEYRTSNIRGLQAIQAGVNADDIEFNWEIMDASSYKYIEDGYKTTLWQEIPEKAAIEYGFEENGNLGRFYTGRHTGNSFAIDGEDVWHELTPGTDPFADNPDGSPKNWTTLDAAGQARMYENHRAGRLMNTQY